jgi:predicted nucleic-acid-binding protein
VIGLDTNVLLRLLLRDDAAQAAQAETLMATRCSVDEPALIASVVLVESVWVLQSGYGYTRAQIAAIVENILRTDVLLVERASEAWGALTDYRRGSADFADCLVGRLNRASGCEATATFDKAAAALGTFIPV